MWTFDFNRTQFKESMGATATVVVYSLLRMDGTIYGLTIFLD